MAALYSHTTRSTGTTLTAAIYNADHENHITNGVPAQLDDYSASVAQMQSTANPGGVGSESQATSLAGELERLRYVLKTVHAGAQWYPGTSLNPGTAKGDLVGYSASGTPTRVAVGTDGYDLVPVSGATAGVAWVSPSLGFSIRGGYLDWSVSGNVLTVAVKTTAGADPSATAPVFIGFRSATVATGSMVWRKLTAATSISINNTATLGTANSTAFRLWCVAFDDAGTVRLGLINCLSGKNIYPLAGWGIASSTLEDATSDSAHVFYTDTASVTSKAYATLGYGTWESGLATAGTWSAPPTRNQLFGPSIPLPGQEIQTQRTDSGAVATGTTTIPGDDTIPQITEGDEYLTRAITPTSAANLLRIESQLSTSHSSASSTNHVIALFQDATVDALAVMLETVGGQYHSANPRLRHAMLAGTTLSTTFRIRAGATNAGTMTVNGQIGGRLFGGVVNSFLEVAEVMA